MAEPAYPGYVNAVCVDYANLRAVAGRPGNELVLVPRDELTHLLDAYDQLSATPAPVKGGARGRRARSGSGEGVPGPDVV